MKKCLLTAFFLCSWNVLLAEEYVIERRDVNANNYRPDTIIIPNSSCNASTFSALCDHMGAKETGQPCKCACKIKKRGIFFKSTFGFYDNKWKCTENTKVRNHGGCSVLFKGETYHSNLTTIVDTIDFDFENVNSGCSITNSSYARCDGTWVELHNNLLKGFVLEDDGIVRYLNYDKSRVMSNLMSLSGRLIRLGITCGFQNQKCVLFKMKGTLNCPISFTSSAPTTQPRPSLTTSLPTSSRPSTSSEATELSPTWLPVQQMQSSSPSVPLVSATPTTVPFSTSTSKILEDGKKSASTKKDNSGLIAGAVAGAIGFAVVVTVIIVVIKRRKKRDALSKNTNVAKDASYGQGADNSLRFSGQRSPDEDEYSYAYTNTVPLAKPANTQVKDGHINDNQENKEKSSDLLNTSGHSNNYAYESMEGLNTQGSPVYHGTDKGPVYKSPKPAMESSVYGSLVRNDQHVYSSLKKPYKKPIELEDEEVRWSSLNKEETYQQLDPVGQRSDGDYQALNHNKKKT